ncbi:dTDP-4-dehydrorhamnose reductase [Priestia megaterium]|uniref:dTDP-4-dehydrorhamnose reductase n=1 Tax=Priestia megaterium TaxID=1404 RepID=UPI000BFD4EEB|nr:dTDP-4-dehydrorhamnose reductase [Priestia megaterium]PGO62594.1 dTDP-4-dehydrorhamnose reductase [Priestia megaterium]
MNRKILITGANGQLGKELVELLSAKGFDVYGCSRDDMDITDSEQVQGVIDRINPEVILHCAAHTKVDMAESEPEKVYSINAYGTRNVAVAAEKIGAKLVYVSTDYVFDGSGTEPYLEFSPTSPLGVYGKSKLAGEEFVKHLHSRFFIVRTSWVYGKHGNNFVKTMLKLGVEKDELTVVADQIGCPTYTLDLAQAILEMIATEKYGIYHFSNNGSCSWYEFAQAIFEGAGIEVKVNPCTTADFPRPAQRPSYSVFSHMSLRLNNFKEPRHWKKALMHYLKANFKRSSS